VKWFLIGSVCLLGSASWVRGDAAADLYNKGISALQNEQYDVAGQTFDKIIAGYPTNPNIDDVRIRAGFAYFYAGKYTEAVERLSKDAADKTKPEYQAPALYFTALAQFSQGQKSNDKNAFAQAAATMTTLINLVTTAPTPDNKGYLEQGIYYRALSQYSRDDYDDAEKDLLRLTQAPQFSASLSRPDYFLRLGSIYAVETNQAVTAKKPAEDIRAMADKALAAFDQVSKDPNALVQANDANMSKAEVLFLIAQMDATSPAGYEKALDAYRQVRRKDDMIALQVKRLEELRQKAQDQARASTSLNSFSNDLSLLLGREEGRLKELQSGPDPIVQALIRMAECYVAMKQPDEARTILHRLVAHAALTPDQQQEIDFQTLYSYVLGGQTGQADKALTDYLAKHSGDPQADSISVMIGGKLLDQKDYAGALAQGERSLKDFPPGKGKYADDAVVLEAQALTRLGRVPESNKIVDDFLKANPTSPKANSLLLSRAQNETSERNLPAALADYQKVKDNASAGPDLQAAADAGYIQTLQSLKKFDDVITEAKAFATQYPSSKALSSVLLLAGLAMDQKHDPGAVAALEDVARKYPKEDAAPFALFYVVNIYQRANNAPAMIQAANDLRKAYPEAYNFLIQAADAVSEISLKQKKFDDAIALYQPLTEAPKPDVAAAARNKIGGVWLAAAKALGAYQSMPLSMRADAETRLSNAEGAYLETLKKFPDQLDAVGDAFEGLITATKQRRSWGLLKDADLEGWLGKLGADLSTPEMQARLELAKAGLVFVTKDGARQYPAALDRFKKVISANPGLRLTRQETDQFGELLLAAQDYPAALKLYGDLLASAAPSDQVALGDGYYGLGATALGQGNVAQAKEYFLKLKDLPGGGLWHPHILEANYGVALADEQSSQPADNETARQLYAGLMQSPQGGVALQAKAMLGYGRLLEKAGNAVKPTAQGPNEYAVHYYQEPHTLFGPAVPALSAEGLFDAGQAYETAGDKANAKKQYADLLENYRTTAPDWAAKAKLRP
jgi:tetratricopeptide (TPR) repeat protein